MLILLAPALMAIAISIAIGSPGPVIYRQMRRDWSGRDLVIFKFRTTVVYPQSEPRYTSLGGVHYTRLGRLLRQCNLDKLPQLWNVLRSEMSLVGPRPHTKILHVFDRAGREIVASYAQHYLVKPGIIGFAPSYGPPESSITISEIQRRVMLDLHYIENWSPWMDLHTLFSALVKLSTNSGR